MASPGLRWVLLGMPHAMGGISRGGAVVVLADCAELYSAPEQYDIEYGSMKDDIPYYLRKLQRCGEVRADAPLPAVLELGCGTGRVTLALAQAGYSVVGLDMSAHMLELARQKASEAGLSVRWVHADCRDFHLSRAFPWVLFPFNSFCHLHDRESVEACLAMVREHMDSTSRFILDLANPSYELMTCQADESPAAAEYRDPCGRGIIVIREHAVYDQLAQVKRITWTYWLGSELLRTARLDMRLFYPQEIGMILHYGGLELVERSGDYEGNPFADDSPRQMLVCQRAT